MKKLNLILAALCCMTYATAQNEAANWYFGVRAGLDFNGGAPVAHTDGELNTIEGCSSISDANGNLLFYTDGIIVWNRNHTPMPNGMGLSGHPSSTQSGIIVPSPASPNIYYVFTVDEAANSKGLQYNTVDMTLNGGLGDIMIKNVLLSTPVTEKLTAVSHANGTDIWVIAHEYGNNNFLAYLVTASGVSTIPVVTSIGHDYEIDNDIRGYMKASPDGGKLALAGHATNGVELFQFDNTSGILSNRITIDNYFITPIGSLFNVTYGLEFSSDSSKLYASNTIYQNIFDTSSAIYQFDLSNYNGIAIVNSGLQVTPYENIPMDGMQLAIDGKIYIARFNQSYLSTIDNPNVLGSGSSYVQNGVSLTGRLSSSGLPPFIQSYFVIGLQGQNFCLGDATEFTLTTNGPATSISWDFGDGNSSTLENPSHIYATPGTYTVSVVATTASETKTESKDIIIYEVPVANSVTDFEACSTNPTYQFDLATKNVEVLGTQLATENTIMYYPSLTDAQNGTNALPNVYSNTNSIETVFARISNVNNSGCFDTTSFDLIVKEAPVLNTVTDWVVCDNDTDGFFDFDLTQKNMEVLNGQSATTFAVSYHENLADAQSNSNNLVSPYTNTVASQTIFFRIENATHPECYETGNIDLEVIPAVSANSVMSLEECDDDTDGYFTFDLSVQNTQILGTQNAADFSITYHSSQAEADNGTNAVNASSYVNTIPYLQFMYVRVENNSNTSCYNTTSFQLVIHQSPIPQVVSDWKICDDTNNGIQSFDLNQKNSEVLGNQSAADFTISYHESQADADANTNAIVEVFQNTSNPQNIYYRIENNSNPICYLSNSFALEVFDTPIVNMPTSFVMCDNDETGIQTFDLSEKDVEVLNGQSVLNFEVFYFFNQTDAETNSNPLSKNGYTNTQTQETIYTRIQNRGMNSCYEVTSFEVIVNPIPRPELEETYVICPDSPELTIDGGDFQSWSWLDENDNEISTDRILNIPALGNYTLTVSNSISGLTCDKTVSFEVVSSGAPEDFTTEISGFSDQVAIEINASGIGDFEYSIDGENFQESNRLEVFPGRYTVYVRDTFLCRTLSKEVIAVGYQKFFTPNSDGTNDYWNVIGAENFPESKIYIFDRYGKLLKQLSPESRGWDGTFQGAQMPSSDYWFRFENEDGMTFTGHFALKR